MRTILRGPSRALPARRTVATPARRPLLVALAAIALAVTACGGDGPTDNSGGGALSLTVTGGGQTARINSALATPPTVLVRDGRDRPAVGVPVTFTVTVGGGQLQRTTATTDAAGVASPGAWTLGHIPGANTLTATAGSGSAARTVTIAATARPPRWTIMVYLAADNTLALAGLDDIEELESLPADPEVQVVVQGEFSPEQFRLAGVTAADANLPGYETFRHLVQRATPTRRGIDGAVTPIGNRDMTDPAQLREFVTWARATYPSERTALVLWNHGGGFQGLIEDMTSSQGRMMSLGDLASALQGTGVLDVLDFDMCLMGGYETLETVRDLARVVSFSQDNVPAAGNPYDRLLAALAADPAMDARAFASVLVDRYDAEYVGGRLSTTKSAFDLAAYPAFAQSLGGLAAALQSNIGTLGAELGATIAASQKFDTPIFTDLVDFVDSLRTRATDASLRAAAEAVRAQATAPAFRIASRTRNGMSASASDLSRATGLHVVLPSGVARDRLAIEGPGSLTAYQQLYGGRPWTSFLSAWLATLPPLPVHDQGEGTRLEIYLTWSVPPAVEPADLDLAVIEPNGGMYIPFLGTITPNGHFTADMYDRHDGYEGYLTNRFVEPGPYYFIALLWADPSNAQPTVDAQYRWVQQDALTSLYAPTLPRMSLANSWLEDEAFTWEKAFSDAYTDFRWMTYYEFAPTSLAGARAEGEAAGREAAVRVPTTGDRARAMAAPPRLTEPQLRTLREIVRQRRARR